MKEQLIKLSEEKGYTSNKMCNHPGASDLTIYLWMCELQKWLREKHGLYAYVNWATLDCVIVDYKNSEGEILLYEDTHIFIPDAESEGEYIDKLLIEALKLIK